jgi:glucokinase
MPAPHLLLGLDIGGTKLGLSVGTPDGTVLAAARVPMNPLEAPEQILARCRDDLLALAAKAAPGRTPAALGAACPGPISYKEGRFLDPPNMPKWHGFGLRDWLKANFAFPAAMMNDANAAALAEWLWGAARGTSTAVFLTMSTGMGSGLIIDGRLYEGPLGLAGEIGRLRLHHGDAGPVGFGKRGSAEGFLSGPGMAQLAASEALICTQLGESTSLHRVLEEHQAISAEHLCQAAAAGDAAARRVTDRCAAELGRLLAIMTDILNPEVFVLGTIGTAYPDLFIPGAMKVLREEAVKHAAAIVRIVPSTLPNRGDQQALAVAWNLLQASSPVAGP